jgi:predicted transcriptional regulator
MTITIEDAELAARLRALADACGEEPGHFAVGLLRRAMDEAEADEAEAAAWWHSLTEQEREAERTRLARGLADVDAGRTRPAEEVYARLRAKYARQTAA